ncbi:MAG: sulfatase-like hydrolase/transferase [Rhodospirillaceae bacterium]
MAPTNTVVIMADEHSSKILGCYGHPQVKTPNMDSIAARGTRFSNHYTSSPICVPARAAFATGRYVSEIGYWDNAIAYDGKVPSWGHRLQEAGHHVLSIGKLHYTDDKAPTGLDEQVIPMHIANGHGDLHGLIRDDPMRREQSRGMAEKVGAAENEYHKYDRDIAQRSADWIRTEASKHKDKPWVLFVSFICPHYPYEVPERYYNMYPPDQIPLPKQRVKPMSDHHHWWKLFENAYCIDEFFEDDDHRRRAIASYYGLCTFVDDQIGMVLKAMEETGILNDTRVAYVSDHGENLGARKLWAKSNMYEEAANIPLILAGPGIPEGKVCATPTTLIDFFPTILDSAGVPLSDEDRKLPGRSLLEIANAPDDPDRIAFSEYHACGSKTASYMVRQGKYKYIHYVDYAPELYDLNADPEELTNLAEDPAHNGLLNEFEAKLRAIVDPEEANDRAKRDQQAKIEEVGGLEFIMKIEGISATPVPK